MVDQCFILAFLIILAFSNIKYHYYFTFNQSELSLGSYVQSADLLRFHELSIGCSIAFVAPRQLFYSPYLNYSISSPFCHVISLVYTFSMEIMVYFILISLHNLSLKVK